MIKYETRCSRPKMETWLALPGNLATPDTTSRIRYFRCADGVEQCRECRLWSYNQAWQLARESVPEGPCVYCGDPDPRTVDHSIARAEGGTDDAGNLVRACRYCNSSKGKLAVEEWLATNRPRAILARSYLKCATPGQLAIPCATAVTVGIHPKEKRRDAA